MMLFNQYQYFVEKHLVMLKMGMSVITFIVVFNFTQECFVFCKIQLKTILIFLLQKTIYLFIEFILYLARKTEVHQLLDEMNSEGKQSWNFISYNDQEFSDEDLRFLL